MKYNFTDRVRKILAMAREEAIRQHHDYVGPDHMLIALVREGGGVGVQALRRAGVDPEALMAEVRARAAAPTGTLAPGELPYTSIAKKALENAMAEARRLDHDWVGSEHLLLGILAALPRHAPLRAACEGVGLRESAVRDAVVHGVAGGERAAPTPEGDDVWFLEIDPELEQPLYEQIVARIEEAVATGRLPVGERLPSVRELAAELGIAPGTVARAYSELESRGVVETRGSKGTRVAERAGRDEDVAELGSMLRKAVVAAYHKGLSADRVRQVLERAMKGIYGLVL